jgi:hypothetical protein
LLDTRLFVLFCYYKHCCSKWFYTWIVFKHTQIYIRSISKSGIAGAKSMCISKIGLMLLNCPSNVFYHYIFLSTIYKSRCLLTTFSIVPFNLIHEELYLIVFSFHWFSFNWLFSHILKNHLFSFSELVYFFLITLLVYFFYF